MNYLIEVYVYGIINFYKHCMWEWTVELKGTVFKHAEWIEAIDSSIKLVCTHSFIHSNPSV